MLSFPDPARDGFIYAPTYISVARIRVIPIFRVLHEQHTDPIPPCGEVKVAPACRAGGAVAKKSFTSYRSQNPTKPRRFRTIQAKIPPVPCLLFRLFSFVIGAPFSRPALRRPQSLFDVSERHPRRTVSVRYLSRKNFHRIFIPKKPIKSKLFRS
jgi:hypothetical protein